MPLALSRAFRVTASAALAVVALSCSDESTKPRNPVPDIASLSPGGAASGGGEVTLTVEGSDFMRLSVVLFDGTTRPTHYVSRTELTTILSATDVAEPGSHQVVVENPAPGGGTSNAATFVVYQGANPAPTLTALSHTNALAGAEADTLFVDGTGFVGSSAVRFNGGTRSTTRVSSTRLRVILVSDDLATPGTYEITVVNPPPGGGTSAGVPFQVVPATPVITALPAAGGIAGRAGFSLAVDGRNFTNGAVVQWNGADRPTTFRSGRRLTAAIEASDVASPGVARITVRNPGVAAGSNEVEFTVRTLATAAVTSQISADVPASDVVFDPKSGLLYASVPSTGGAYGNSIVAIDPNSGAVTKSVFVGSEPEFLAVSDGGEYLYVALRGASSVRRVNLATFTAGLEFSLGNGLVVEEMAVVPGAPQSVVVAKMNAGSSPRHVGVFVYDDGTQRATATPSHTGSNSITFDGRGSSVLFGYDNETTEFGFRTMAIDASGISVTSVTGGLIGSFYTRLLGAGGRVYGTNGAIIDPDLRSRTGSFSANTAGSTVAIAADPALGRVFFLVSGSITAFDVNTMQSLGTLAVPGVIGDHPAVARLHLTRWGTDGLAYRASDKVFILRTTLSSP